MKMPWRYVLVVVPSYLAFSVLVEAGFAAAALAAVVSGVVCYALTGAPPRYRRHGWRHVDEAVGHALGQSAAGWPGDEVGWEVPPAPPVGRNDLCPCGSGAKYKRCCGQ